MVLTMMWGTVVKLATAVALCLPVVLLASLAGCTGPQSNIRPAEKTIIRAEGSDTMVNLAQAWAELHHQLYPTVEVHVLGGGSGVGIASLIDGTCDLANSSREMTAEERRSLREKRGVEAVEYVVGFDALAVYVHKSNPLDTVSLPELAEIFGDGGTITHWSQLGVEIPGARSGRIIRVSRQNSSGTYAYFRETVLGKRRDMGLGSLDANGSKDAVALVSRTPTAIGYTGMGYITDQVKVLRVARRPGEPGVLPCVRTATDRSYPLTRPLLIYTAGHPQGQLKQYIDWIMGPQGQQVVLELGYVPASAGSAQTR